MIYKINTPRKGNKKNPTQCCKVWGVGAAHWSPVYINIVCLYLAVFVWYPAFVGAFYLGSCIKCGCRFGHQEFLYELCLPAKKRPETSTVLGRKTAGVRLLYFISNSKCVCVCMSERERERETEGISPQRHSDCIKERLTQDIRGATLPIVLLVCCGQENTSRSHKNVWAHLQSWVRGEFYEHCLVICFSCYAGYKRRQFIINTTWGNTSIDSFLFLSFPFTLISPKL